MANLTVRQQFLNVLSGNAEVRVVDRFEGRYNSTMHIADVFSADHVEDLITGDDGTLFFDRVNSLFIVVFAFLTLVGLADQIAAFSNTTDAEMIEVVRAELPRQRWGVAHRIPLDVVLTEVLESLDLLVDGESSGTLLFIGLVDVGFERVVRGGGEGLSSRSSRGGRSCLIGGIDRHVECVTCAVVVGVVVVLVLLTIGC